MTMKMYKKLWIVVVLLVLPLIGCKTVEDNSATVNSETVSEESWEEESVERVDLTESTESPTQNMEDISAENVEASTAFSMEVPTEDAETTEAYVRQVKTLPLKMTKFCAVGWSIDFDYSIRDMIDYSAMNKKYRFDVAGQYVDRDGYVLIKEDMVQNGKVMVPLVTFPASEDIWYLEMELFDEETAPEWYQWSQTLIEWGDIKYIDNCLTRYMTEECQLGTDAFWDALASALVDLCGLENDPRYIYEGLCRMYLSDLKIEGDWDEFESEANQQAMFSVAVGLCRLPDTVFQHFVEYGGGIRLLNEKLGTEVEGMDIVGEFVHKNQSIQLTSVYGYTVGFEKTIVHEMAHYVDLACGQISESKEWVTYAKNAKAKVGDQYNNVLLTGLVRFEDVIKNRIGDLGYLYREYSFHNQREFFADSFVLYLICPEVLEATYPDVYAAMDDCIKNFK